MSEWIMVVDDDVVILKSAGQILSKNHMRVTGLQSGEAMIRYLQENDPPDLILLDINLPGMNGFEALQNLRSLEAGKRETPVIFLTGDSDQASEIRGLQAGAMDYLRKPFSPDVLIGRVQRVLRTQDRMNRFEHAAAIDKMTGMLNKEASDEKMRRLCSTETGFLCILDLDSFKSVNDLYGHDTGDRVLVLFSNLLKKEMRHNDVCGRIGGDEFILFLRNMKSGDELRLFIDRINRSFQEGVGLLVGRQLPLGVSAGAVSVPEHGRDFEKLFSLADDNLYAAKQNGKHDVSIAENSDAQSGRPNGELTLEAVTSVLEERTIPSSAMWMGTDAFTNIYQYMVRYMERYQGVAFRALFTVRMKEESCSSEERSAVMDEFRKVMQNSLRSSDVMVEVSDNQLFMLLPEAGDQDIDQVVARLLHQWKQSEYNDSTTVTYEAGRVLLSNRKNGTTVPAGGSDLVVVVDDDRMLRKVAEAALSGDDMKVDCLSSGSELLEYMKHNRPDLILLDVMMPEMDGFETLSRLKGSPMIYRDIPVILLTADETQESEIRGLQLGARDFIRKPFVPEVLAMRVRNLIDLTRLQYHLNQEVVRKAAEISRQKEQGPDPSDHA